MRILILTFVLFLARNLTNAQSISEKLSGKLGFGYGVNLTKKLPENIGGLDHFYNERSYALPVVLGMDYRLNSKWSIGLNFRNFNLYPKEDSYKQKMEERFPDFYFYQDYYPYTGGSAAPSLPNISQNAFFIHGARRHSLNNFELIGELGFGIRKVFHAVHYFSTRVKTRNDYRTWALKPNFTLYPCFEGAIYFKHSKFPDSMLSIDFITGPVNVNYRVENIDHRGLMLLQRAEVNTWMSGLSLKYLLLIESSK